MAEVFKRGEDLHAASAAAILGKPLDQLTDEDRQVGKTYNFLTIYGGGPGKASRSLGVTFEVAKEQQDKFHASWPAIKKLHNPPRYNGTYGPGQLPGQIQRRLKERGYITTLWGGHLHPRSPHMALNALVQGCAADLMRASMVRVHKAISEFESHLVNVVHDELIFDCIEGEIDAIVPVIVEAMTDWEVNDVVPVEVDVEYSSTSWADKAPIAEARPRNDGQPDDLGQPGSLLAA